MSEHLFVIKNKVHQDSCLVSSIFSYPQDLPNIFSNINNGEVVGLDFSATTYYFLTLLEKNNIKYKDIINSCILSKASFLRLDSLPKIRAK